MRPARCVVRTAMHIGSGNNQSGVKRFTGYDFSSLGIAVVSVYQTDAAFGAFTAGTEMSDYADRIKGAGLFLSAAALGLTPSVLAKLGFGLGSHVQAIGFFAADIFGVASGVIAFFLGHGKCGIGFGQPHGVAALV